MSSVDQAGLQQRTGYVAEDQSGGYVNENGYGGPQGSYPPQQNYGYGGSQGSYPPQQNYEYGPNTSAPYQGQTVGANEFVDKHGRVVRRKRRGGRLAACLTLCWCCTWPCHGPCCGGL